jgi:hypothetical protein
VNEPTVDLQFGHNEFEIKLSSFDDDNRETFLDTIKDLRFDAMSVGKWLVPYGDPTKSNLYRFGLHIPKTVDAERFVDWLVEQLRTIQLEDGAWLQVNHVPEFRWTRP